MELGTGPTAAEVPDSPLLRPERASVAQTRLLQLAVGLSPCAGVAEGAAHHLRFQPFSKSVALLDKLDGEKMDKWA